MEIENHWISGAKKIKSPNYNSRPDENDISLLVIHNISLPPGKFGKGYVEKFFTNNLPIKDDVYFKEISKLKVSSHLFISRKGEVTQFVPFNKRAWHAGKSMFQKKIECNDFSIGIEVEGTDKKAYTDIQYEKLVEVTNVILSKYPHINLERISGHNEIAPNRKTDPGESFDWNRYFCDINLKKSNKFPVKLKSLKPGGHIHLMGICGTAMASLAGLFKELGYKVTGSDQNVYPPMSTQLEELKIPVMEGYKKENLNPKPDLVIVGNVIQKKFEEAQYLLNSDIPYTSLPKAMGDHLISDRNSIVITGTHGKTTTTSILSWIAETCEKNPGFMIGGIPENFSHSFRKPSGDWFIIEGDEYDTAFFDKVPKFIHYKPKYVVLSSIEFDHADIYNDLDDVKKSFYQLMDLIPEDGLLIANADDKNVMEVAKKAKCKVITYGLEKGDYKAVDREVLLGRNQFCVEFKNERIADIAIKQFGPHNTLNTLAALALAIELKWPLQKILQGLASFKGVKRRQEIIGEPNNITIIEDFAHHPTAVKLTLQTMRERFPDRKIISIFEPRSATSRRKIFQDQYLDALKNSDVSIVAEPQNQKSISKQDRFSTVELIKKLEDSGVNAKSSIMVILLGSPIISCLLFTPLKEANP